MNKMELENIIKENINSIKNAEKRIEELRTEITRITNDNDFDSNIRNTIVHQSAIEIKNLEAYKERLEIEKKYHIANYKYCIYKELEDKFFEILHKYSGKRLGSKTTEKLLDELDEISYEYYFNIHEDRYFSVVMISKYIPAGDSLKISFDSYLTNDENKLNKFDKQEAHINCRYHADVHGEADFQIEMLNKIEEARKELLQMIEDYNSFIPAGSFKDKLRSNIEIHW